ncbi:MAG TPA: hypothetical protein VKA09_00830 [Nitrososphaeraceae archaeon]|nr:hypothetical protein [Nitrososphaeraceae archaeon]
MSRYKLIKWLLEVFQSINDSKIFNGSGLFMLMYALLIILTTILTSIAIFPIFPIESLAHRDGCHRWHSCPSDDGSYVCGDLGYDDECGGSEEEDTDNGEDIEPANDDTISSNDDNDNGDNDSNGDDTESQSYYKR